jgi:hypothetical protein
LSNSPQTYQNIVPIDRTLHANWSLSPLADAGFSRSNHAVLLLASEFVEAAREYPIVFLRRDGQILPIAVLGLREGENLFVNELGQWSARYIPAYVRRYPFIFADAAGGEPLLALDSAYPGLDTTGQSGQRLFDQDGKESAFLKSMLAFVQGFQDDYQRTLQWCAELERLGLFKDASINHGGQVSMHGFLAIDEQKLMQLAQTDVLRLFRGGALGTLFAHLMSLGNINHLAQRLVEREAMAASR